MTRFPQKDHKVSQHLPHFYVSIEIKNYITAKERLLCASFPASNLRIYLYIDISYSNGVIFASPHFSFVICAIHRLPRVAYSDPVADLGLKLRVPNIVQIPTWKPNNKVVLFMPKYEVKRLKFLNVLRFNLFLRDWGNRVNKP